VHLHLICESVNRKLWLNSYHMFLVKVCLSFGSDLFHSVKVFFFAYSVYVHNIWHLVFYTMIWLQEELLSLICAPYFCLSICQPLLAAKFSLILTDGCTDYLVMLSISCGMVADIGRPGFSCVLSDKLYQNLCHVRWD